MEKLEKTFQSVLEKFNARKAHFRKKIDRWGEKGKTAWHKKGITLLDIADELSKELKAAFGGDVKVDQRTVRAKIKRFKQAYKQLHEATKPELRQWIEALIIAGVAALFLRNFIFGLYHVPSGSAEPTILVGDRVWGNKMAYLFGDTPKRGDQVIFDEIRFRFDQSNTLRRLWQKYVGFEIPLLGLPGGPINVVKRVIAVPGDWIEGRLEEGKPVIYINGKKLDEPYVNPFPLIWLKKERGFVPFDRVGPFMIPDFLRKSPVLVKYTYDPNRSFAQQQFYKMDKSEVIRIPGIASFSYPQTPTYKDVAGTECVDIFGPLRVPPRKYWVMGDSRKNSTDSRFDGFLDESHIHGRLSFIIYSIDSQEPVWLFELLKHPFNFWFKAVRWDRFLKKPTPVIVKK